MTGHKEADLLLSNYRTQIRSIVQDSVQNSLRGLDAQQRDSRTSFSAASVDKDLLDIITSEIKSSIVPSVEKLVVSMDSAIASRLSSFESKLQRAVESRRRDEAELLSRIQRLEGKLSELRNIELPSFSQTQIPVSRNPYADIEASANIQDWTRAFSISVSVANGTDFLTHLLRERYPSAEDFFLQNPVPDALLALQVAVNLARELLLSDKYCDYKLEMINELVLNLVNPSPNGVSEKFAQLKDALSQLLNIIPPSTSLCIRVKEILKIVAATDRLISPQSSAVSTPPRSDAYF